MYSFRIAFALSFFVLVYNVAVYLYSVYSGRCILIGRCLEVKEGSGIQQIWQHKMSRNSKREKEGKMCWRKTKQNHHLFNHDGKLSLFCPKDGTHNFDEQKVIPKEN